MPSNTIDIYNMSRTYTRYHQIPQLSDLYLSPSSISWFSNTPDVSPQLSCQIPWNGQIWLSCDPLNWYHTYPHITTRIGYQIAYPVIVSKWGWVKTIQPIPHSPCFPSFSTPGPRHPPACPIPQLPRWKFPFLDCLSHYNLKKWQCFIGIPILTSTGPLISPLCSLYINCSHKSHSHIRHSRHQIRMKHIWTQYGKSWNSDNIWQARDNMALLSTTSGNGDN